MEKRKGWIIFPDGLSDLAAAFQLQGVGEEMEKINEILVDKGVHLKAAYVQTGKENPDDDEQYLLSKWVDDLYVLYLWLMGGKDESDLVEVAVAGHAKEMFEELDELLKGSG